jgi:hypothetical protein
MVAIYFFNGVSMWHLHLNLNENKNLPYIVPENMFLRLILLSTKHLVNSSAEKFIYFTKVQRLMTWYVFTNYYFRYNISHQRPSFIERFNISVLFAKTKSWVWIHIKLYCPPADEFTKCLVDNNINRKNIF